MLEWDQNQNALRDELPKEPLKLESDGSVRLPEAPGLGIELDRAAVERYQSRWVGSAERVGVGGNAVYDRLRKGAAGRC